MPKVTPFRGIRPNPSVVERVAALPYDVYNRKEACEVTKREPLSFLNIDRAETQFSSDVDTYAPCVYEKARELLDARIADGTFIQDEKPVYYVYALTMDGRTQTGIVACSDIDDYQNNTIKKHENTRESKEQDRIRHVDATDAHTGPIFLVYRQIDSIRQIVAKTKETTPIYNYVAEDGVRHAAWIIDNPADVKLIEEGFAKIPATYIADGHHRCASAVKVGLKRRAENPNHTGKEGYNRFLSVLFPDDEMMIMDYNRVVKDLNGLTEDAFMERLMQLFTVECKGQTQVHPEKKGTFGMYLSNNWYHLTAKQDILSEDAVEGLDVSVLQNSLLGPVLGIGDPRTDERIDFIGGIRGLDELEKRCKEDMTVAFAMYPTSIEELLSVADAKRLMPPKSTWFEPKLRSGLFIHRLTD
ncbi:MAG: DUF1015 family protein [Lachnospiraceae bacterium]